MSKFQRANHKPKRRNNGREWKKISGLQTINLLRILQLSSSISGSKRRIENEISHHHQENFLVTFNTNNGN